MDVNTMKLSDIPEIKELLKVLEENGRAQIVPNPGVTEIISNF